MSAVTVPLRSSNVDAIAQLGVPVPTYDRSALVPRIVHVGVGGFHRAHMALYTEEAAAAGGDWGIRGVGLLEADRRMADVLGRQDRLYTVVERDGDGSQARVVGSIVDFALVAGDEAAFAAHVADPDVAIVSLTITEAGYSLTTRNPTIEALVAGLDARRAAGGRPITVLSCDNLQRNGDTARAAATAVAQARSVDLARYVEEACTFPNSMVDRITPQTTDEDRTWLRDEIGIDDGWPVVCEPFRQWVVEDRFAAGRPSWEDVGVLFSDRVHDWEQYKLRMLNASHSCMAYPMALAHVVHVDEAMAVPVVRRYLEQLLGAEVIPTLVEIPGHPAVEYADTVLRRYENTGVRDTIGRLCADGTAKFPNVLVPTVEAQLERGGPVSCAALALAAWSRYLATVPAGDRAVDTRGERAAQLASRALADPLAFLELDEVFTAPVRNAKSFRDAFAAASRDLAEHGPIEAIERVLDRDVS